MSQAQGRKAHFSEAKFKPLKCLFHFYLFSSSLHLMIFTMCSVLLKVEMQNSKTNAAVSMFVEKAVALAWIHQLLDFFLP